MGREFGRCPCGQASFEVREVQVRMKVRDEMVELTGIPQGACPSCGSRVYKAEILARIESVMTANAIDPQLADRSDV